MGTSPIKYDLSRRGFLPFADGNDNAIRVLPAKYSVFIATQMKGSKDKFGPMRFKDNVVENGVRKDDNELNFWVPLHKLFNGPECIRNMDLHVNLHSHHVNEKVRRIHKSLSNRGMIPVGQNLTLATPRSFSVMALQAFLMILI